MKSGEWKRVWVLSIFKTELQETRPNNSAFLQNWLPQKVRSPLFNLRKFLKTQKNTTESCIIYWSDTNDAEIGSFKILKLKYRRGDLIIQSFSRIGSTQKIRSPLFNLRKFLKTEKNTAYRNLVLLFSLRKCQNDKKSTSESCRIYWDLMNNEEFRSFHFSKLKNRRRGGGGGGGGEGAKNLDVLQNWFYSRN